MLTVHSALVQVERAHPFKHYKAVQSTLTLASCSPLPPPVLSTLFAPAANLVLPHTQPNRNRPARRGTLKITLPSRLRTRLGTSSTLTLIDNHFLAGACTAVATRIVPAVLLDGDPGIRLPLEDVLSASSCIGAR